MVSIVISHCCRPVVNDFSGTSSFVKNPSLFAFETGRGKTWCSQFLITGFSNWQFSCVPPDLILPYSGEAELGGHFETFLCYVPKCKFVFTKLFSSWCLSRKFSYSGYDIGHTVPVWNSGCFSVTEETVQLFFWTLTRVHFILGHYFLFSNLSDNKTAAWILTKWLNLWTWQERAEGKHLSQREENICDSARNCFLSRLCWI